MIQGIVFDKDGTLFDFAATWERWAEALLMRLAEDDLAHAKQAGHAIGFDMETHAFAPDSVAIAGTPEALVERLQPAFPTLSSAHLDRLINEEAEKARQHPVVPLIPLLSGLRAQSYALGVATNDAERPARAHLDQAGVTEMFDFIAGYDSGFGSKPAPGQLLAFCKAVGLHPEQVAMVGDSTHDLHAGRAAGMLTVAVLTGLAPKAVLAPLADVVLPDIGHLDAWLKKRS
ncbi:MAG: HAD family hydrolase [Pseudomonadota bacterium]